MKAIIINGSPRKKWNTDKALQRAAEGFSDADGTVETIRLYEFSDRTDALFSRTLALPGGNIRL